MIEDPARHTTATARVFNYSNRKSPNARAHPSLIPRAATVAG
jgi:hypothetical protein